MTPGATISGPTLLYLAYEYPVLTQTFTVNEVRGLRRAGLTVEVFSCRTPRSGEDAPDHVAGPALSRRSLLAFAGWLLRRPVRTLALVGLVASASYRDEPLKCWARGFTQLLWGAKLAEDLRLRGERPHLHAQFVDAASTVALVAARLLGTTFSVTNHTAYNPYLLVPKLRLAAFLVSISKFDRRLTLRMARGGRAGRIAVVYQGIDPEAFRFSPRPPLLAQEPVRILSVAALREKKGHGDLLKAVATLRTQGRPVRATIVGEGPERRRLEILRRDLGLEGVVDLAGAESPARVRERIAEADVFVLACRKARNGDIDGIPISLMEAMAAGVPVVSTRISGVPELIEDGREGLLAATGDAEGIARCLAATLSDPGAAADRAARARQKILRQHDLEGSVQAMAALFRGGRR